MKNSKQFLITASSIAFAAFLAGCGDNNKSSTPSSIEEQAKRVAALSLEGDADGVQEEGGRLLGDALQTLGSALKDREETGRLDDASLSDTAATLREAADLADALAASGEGSANLKPSAPPAPPAPPKPSVADLAKALGGAVSSSPVVTAPSAPAVPSSGVTNHGGSPSLGVFYASSKDAITPSKALGFSRRTKFEQQYMTSLIFLNNGADIKALAAPFVVFIKETNPQKDGVAASDADVEAAVEKFLTEAKVNVTAMQKADGIKSFHQLLKNTAVSAYEAFEGVQLADAAPALRAVKQGLPRIFNTLKAEDLTAILAAKDDTDLNGIIAKVKAEAGKVETSREGSDNVNYMYPSIISDEKMLPYFKYLVAKVLQSKNFNPALLVDAPAALALSSGASIKDLSGGVSLREARTSLTGSIDARNFKNGGYVSLDAPVFVQLSGNFNAAKTTDALTGAAAYRIGNTVIGAIQAYANTGAGFGADAKQLESSVVASQSFNNFFVEGQFGAVSAENVHFSNWAGSRSQLTVGYDAAYVTPFVQVLHRNLTRDLQSANDAFAFVGLDMELTNVNGFTSHLLTKAGISNQSNTQFVGSVEWSSTLNLTSGVSFGSNLSLDSTTSASAGINLSVEY